MRGWLGALGIASVLTGAAAAQPIAGRAHLVGGFTQLFISPCGEPYRGRPGEPYPVALWFKQADLNHDGVIDRTEFRADHAGFFDALDADGNGVLEGAEIAFYEHRVVPDVLGGEARFGALDGRWRGGAVLIRAQQGPPDQQSSPIGGAQGPPSLLPDRRGPDKVPLEGAAAYGLLAEPEPVTAADIDLDGRVSKAEFLAAADRRFKRLDRKGDGKLTLDELPKTASQAEAEYEAAHRKR
jgi:hypothetical protein